MAVSSDSKNKGKSSKTGFFLEGLVVSDKMDKTVVVEVSRTFRHPVFGKVVRQKKKYKVHDGNSECKVGDIVLIKQVAPISKLKHMAVEKIIRE